MGQTGPPVRGRPPPPPPSLLGPSIRERRQVGRGQAAGQPPRLPPEVGGCERPAASTGGRPRVVGTSAAHASVITGTWAWVRSSIARDGHHARGPAGPAPPGRWLRPRRVRPDGRSVAPGPAGRVAVARDSPPRPDARRWPPPSSAAWSGSSRPARWPRPGVALAEALEVAGVGPVPAVDGLVGVAHHAQVGAVAPPGVEQPELERVHVLELVHEQVLEAPALGCAKAPRRSRGPRCPQRSRSSKSTMRAGACPPRRPGTARPPARPPWAGAAGRANVASA